MAKLDFFVRYPLFFAQACVSLNEKVEKQVDTVDANMVRYHYGPWDRRYYHVLAYLEARELIKAEKENKTFHLTLTPLGDQIAAQFVKDNNFRPIVEQMQQVKKVLGGKKGTELKKLVYKLFDEEVAQRRIGETIEP